MPSAASSASTGRARPCASSTSHRWTAVSWAMRLRQKPTVRGRSTDQFQTAASSGAASNVPASLAAPAANQSTSSLSAGARGSASKSARSVAPVSTMWATHWCTRPVCFTSVATLQPGHAGDRVAVEVFQSCRSCDACRRGDYRRCSVHGLADMYGLVAADRQPGLWGGYAEQLYLSPDAIVLPVPAALDPVVATVFNPLGAGVRWGVTLPGTKKGDIVAVLGPGMRGLSVLAAAKEAGAGFVLVTGAGARDAERLALAEEFGADAVVDVTEADPVATLRQATGGRRADVVVDVTAKAPAAFAQAVELARTGGTVVVAGTRGEPGAPGLGP